MISLALALVLSQATPTRAEGIGALNTLYAAVMEARAGQRTVTRNAARTRICIAPAGTLPAGTVTVRASAALLSAAVQNLLGFTGTATEDAYVAIEVQAVPSLAPTFDRMVLDRHLELLRDASGDLEVEVRPAPVNAACEVGIVRSDDATWGTLVRCACRVDATCLYDADGAGPGVASAAPVGMTLPPGSWSGAGCKAKPCVARFDTYLETPTGRRRPIDRTWPAACPK